MTDRTRVETLLDELIDESFRDPRQTLSDFLSEMELILTRHRDSKGDCQ